MIKDLKSKPEEQKEVKVIDDNEIKELKKKYKLELERKDQQILMYKH